MGVGGGGKGESENESKASPWCKSGQTGGGVLGSRDEPRRAARIRTQGGGCRGLGPVGHICCVTSAGAEPAGTRSRGAARSEGEGRRRGAGRTRQILGLGESSGHSSEREVSITMASVSPHENQEKSPHAPPPPSKQSLLFCPKSKLHIHRAEISKIVRECQEESFWKRALPFSLVSMLVTQGLVYQGYLAANPRFGSLPKVALAGILGFGLGKASYIRVCQKKFHLYEDQLRGAGFGPQHNRHCLLTCEECKIKRALTENSSSQPSAS